MAETLVELTPELRTLVGKLMHCQDSQTGEQIFIGSIKVEVIHGVAFLAIEETTWETPSGDVINTAWIKSKEQ